jgi:hypothetical protein
MIAGILLLNLSTTADAFIALANVLNRPLPLSFYTGDPGAKASAYNLVLQTLQQKSPTLHSHLTNVITEADPDLYLNSAFTSILTGNLAMDESARLWDVYVFEGDAVLVRAVVALLMTREIPILNSKTADEVRLALHNNPSDDNRKVLAEAGAEDRWMKCVKDAGRA